MKLNVKNVIVIFLLMFFLGCGGGGGDDGQSVDNPQSPEFWPSADAEAISAIVADAGKLEPLEENQDVKTNMGTDYEGDFKCTYEKHDVVDNIDSICYLGLNDDIVWPGNLVMGYLANDFIYTPIAVDRAPITLSISLESSTNAGDKIVQEVNEPKLSTIRQGISDLLKNAITQDTSVPAKAEFECEQVYNKSQMNIFLNTDVSYGAGNLETQFDWSESSTTNKIVAKYRQIYYSIDIDAPAVPADFFSPSMTIEEIKDAVPPGSYPLYVASVTYGMMAVVCIETSYSEEQMKAALNASYEGLVDVDIGLGLTNSNVLSNSNIKTIVYGGSTKGLSDIEMDYDGFLEVIKASQNFSADTPGVPISYKFRQLSDNTMALITLTSQYTLVKPLLVKQRVKVTVDNLVCVKNNDEGANNNIEMRYFDCHVTAYNGEDENGAPGSMVAVDKEIFKWSVPGSAAVGFKVGRIHSVNSSVVLEFDTEDYDFNSAWIQLKGYNIEDDDDSIFNHDDTGSGKSPKILGSDFLKNGGQHTFTVYTSDSGFKYNITIEMITPTR